MRHSFRAEKSLIPPPGSAGQLDCTPAPFFSLRHVASLILSLPRTFSLSPDAPLTIFDAAGVPFIFSYHFLVMFHLRIHSSLSWKV